MPLQVCVSFSVLVFATFGLFSSFSWMFHRIFHLDACCCVRSFYVLVASSRLSFLGSRDIHTYVLAVCTSELSFGSFQTSLTLVYLRLIYMQFSFLRFSPLSAPFSPSATTVFTHASAFAHVLRRYSHSRFLISFSHCVTTADRTPLSFDKFRLPFTVLHAFVLDFSFTSWLIPGWIGPDPLFARFASPAHLARDSRVPLLDTSFSFTQVCGCIVTDHFRRARIGSLHLVCIPAPSTDSPSASGFCFAISLTVTITLFLRSCGSFWFISPFIYRFTVYRILVTHRVLHCTTRSPFSPLSTRTFCASFSYRFKFLCVRSLSSGYRLRFILI